MKNIMIVGDRQRELLQASLILRPPSGDPRVAYGIGRTEQKCSEHNNVTS